MYPAVKVEVYAHNIKIPTFKAEEATKTARPVYEKQMN